MSYDADFDMSGEFVCAGCGKKVESMAPCPHCGSFKTVTVAAVRSATVVREPEYKEVGNGKVFEDDLITVAYGGGLNSKAMLLEWHKRGLKRPDLILFADTGGEKPETYADIRHFQEWLKSVGYPELVTVSNDGMYKTLENNCLETGTLPSLAYGWKSCSDKYKKRPQEKYINRWDRAKAHWKAGKKVVKLIGIDAGEARRATMTEDDKYRYLYPLNEWDYDREDCVRIVEESGLPVPPKSSCFFCPAMKKPEIRDLAANHPDLFDRAVAMERNAAENLKTVKGLGRRFSWEEFIDSERKALPMAEECNLPVVDTNCMCYDGDPSPPAENDK